MDNRRILTVTELNGSIRALLEGRFPFISVAGEISNLHRPASGHYYFTLKDRAAQIKAVLFRTQQRYLAAAPKDGMQVICRGRISVYEPRGEYQLIVDAVEVHGAGVLQQAFEELKRRLAAEGLFDEHLKRGLPNFPEHLTLVTSPRGAAVHDFIRIARRRLPSLQIAIYPVTVQGDQAAGEMIRAIEAINAQLPNTSAIVLCRGGGSIEDLQAFNDEGLARAIRASARPVVSAVGHEIDFTIADFAADLRAPTPSGAAELLTPDAAELRRGLARERLRLQRLIETRIDGCRHRLVLARQRLETMPHPLDRLMLRVDQLSLTLQAAMQGRIARAEQQLHRIGHRLGQHNPANLLVLRTERLAGLHRRLKQAMRAGLAEQNKHLARVAGLLHAVSPLATLARGYAIVRSTEGRQGVVRDEARVRIGDTVRVTLQRGELRCRVEGKQAQWGMAEDQDGTDQSRTASTS